MARVAEAKLGTSATDAPIGNTVTAAACFRVLKERRLLGVRMAPQVKGNYERLVSDEGTSFDAFYRIYAESMPTREQKPRSEIRAMVKRSDYRFVLAKRQSVIIGFSVLFLPPEESFCLLEYMAIDTVYRNAGAGAELFRHCVKDVLSEQGDITALLEVDSDREECADRAIRRRRQDFYKRLGCSRIDGLSYLLPLPGEGPPPQMDLMVHSSSHPLVIRRPELEHWLKVVYQRVYNCSTHDPRIAQMMESVADPVKLV